MLFVGRFTLNCLMAPGQVADAVQCPSFLEHSVSILRLVVLDDYFYQMELETMLIHILQKMSLSESLLLVLTISMNSQRLTPRHHSLSLSIDNYPLRDCTSLLLMRY